MRERRLRLADRLRIERAVQRVDWVLDGRVPIAKRRQVRNELRSNLVEAAQEVGAEKAIQQLGDLREVAEDTQASGPARS